MRLPRFQIRTLLVTVAVVAISLWVGSAWPSHIVGDMLVMSAYSAIGAVIVVSALALAFAVLVAIAGLLMETGECLSRARRRRKPE